MKQNNKNEKIVIGNDKLLSDIKSKPADEVTELAESIINTVREPLLILDKDLRVVKANRSFFDYFKVSYEETIGTLIYDLGNRQWDILKLRELLETILPEKTTFDNYEVEHDFSTIGKRIMLLNARQIERVFGKEKIILLAIEDITERKHLEESLSEKSRMTSEYLDILVNHAHFPIIIWDASFVITRFNNSFEKLSGYDISEVMGKKIDFLFPENKRESTLKLLEDFLGEEKFEIIEIDILRKDKEIRTVLWNSANVFDKEGKLIITTIAQDITKRKRTEDALKENEEIFNHFLENSPYYVFFKDKNIRTLRLSANYEQMLGKPLTSVLGKTMDELFPSELAKKMIEVDKEILNRRKTVIVEEKFNGRDFTTIKFPIIINDIPQYLAGFTIDITEQKRAEAALRENEKFLKETQKIAQLGSYTFDLNTGIWKSSEILDSIFGIESDYDKSVEGWTSIIHPEWQQLMEDYLAYEVIGQRKSFDKEYKIVRKSDKTERWVHGLGELVFDKENKPIKMIGTIRDITELKNAEREIVNLNRVYALLSNTNEAIVRIKDRQKLFDEICRIAIDNGKFRMAWIGIVNNDINKVDVKASAGLIENYLEDINIDLSNEIRSEGPAGKVIKNGTNIIVNDIENDKNMIPWKENALRLGYKSCAIFPLNVFGKVIGVFSIYSNQKDFFHQQEIRLLDKMAMDISFALEFFETEENRKIVEENLRISEERFRSLYENSTIGLYRTTPDGNILMANKVLVKMLGFPSFEKLARRNLEKDGFEPSYERKEFIEKIEKEGEINDFESVWSRQDGSKFFVRESAQAIRDLHGSTLYYDGVVEDITERKRAEEVLQQERDFSRTIIQTSPTFFVAIGSDGKTIMMNDSMLETLGYTLSEVVEMDYLTNFIAVEDREKVSKIFEELVTTNKSTFNENHILTKDGRKIIVEWHGKNILKPNGELNYFFGIGIDITERKLAEEKIRKLYTGIEHSPASVVITDIKGNIEYVNTKFCEVTGYDYNEIIGKNPNILQSGEMPKSKYEEMWNIILSGNDWQGEFHNKKKNGELYWESASISPIKNEKGEVTHFIGIKEDITEKKNMIDELIQAKEKAEEMNRLKSNFLANMSHELRTPLVGILGYAEIIRQEKVSPEIKVMAETIYKSGNRLSETLNLILDLSRFETEKKEIKYQRVELVEKTKEVITLFNEAAHKKGLLLLSSFSSESIFINFDDRAYNSILSNLINNAIKFTSEGSITTSVSLYDHSVEINVADTGIGIAENDFEFIFDEFRQASEGYTRNFEGSGLGLSITKKLVEKYGGTITVESEVGKGSTFKVILPVTNDLENLKEQAASEMHSSTKSPKTKLEKPLGLLVDDDSLVFQVMKRYLRDDVELETTVDAEFAAKMLREKKYNIIFMDINLNRGMDGKKAAAMIRKMHGYEFTPIIATTAYALEGDKEEFISAGCSHYLSKPFNKTEIIDVVTEALKQK